MKNDVLFLIIVMLASLSARTLSAQEVVIPDGYELADSLVYRPVSAVDTTLAGKDIFSIMPSRLRGDRADVEIHQSQDIAVAMRNYLNVNPDRQLNGYRVRIFFDNKQTARMESEAALLRFESLYHDVAAYRTYANPYFKVTVGDFRTKSEAMELLERIRHEFPSAFVVKESICFPVVDKANAYVVDTVKVLRPVKVSL